MVAAKGKDDKSCEEQEHENVEKETQQLDKAEDVEPADASGEVLVYTGIMEWRISLLNYLEVSVGPLSCCKSVARSAHVRLSTRLRNQTELIGTTDAGRAKDVGTDTPVRPPLSPVVVLESC